jgi:hypothetical protein
MKKFATIAALMATALGALAQGTVDFRSPSGVFVTWGANGAGAPGTPIAGDAGVKVGLYYSSGGSYTLVSTQFPIVGTLSSGTINANVNGRFTGNPSIITVPGLVAGQNGTFQVRAWSGNFTSYEAASSGGALYLGNSGDFTNPSGGVGDPATPASPLSGFTGMTVAGGVIPEPSTMAIAGLGLGALLLIRRRK